MTAKIRRGSRSAARPKADKSKYPTGAAPDRLATIPAGLRSWEAAQARLVPVIGESGFRILFERSLHLTRREYPWLSRVTTTTQAPLADLQASLEGNESGEQALEASRALLANFTGLLALLIGEALTSRLLDPAAPGPVRTP